MFKLPASIAVTAAAAVLFLLSSKSSLAPQARVPSRRLKARTQHHKQKQASLQQYQGPPTKQVRITADTTIDTGLVLCSSHDGVQVPIAKFYSTHKKGGCYHDFTNHMVYFHVGKGGGGTVEQDLIHHNRIHAHVSHPVAFSMYKHGLTVGPLQKVVINIRDPVDRFKSAFYWEVEICGPNLRFEGRSNPRCQGGLEEWNLVTQRYQSDASVLAEALCEESPSFQEADEDYNSKMIFMHHKDPLSSWLDFLIDPAQKDSFNTEAGIQQIFAVPMEKPHMDGQKAPLLEQHVKRLTLYLLEERYDPEVAKELLMHAPYANGEEDHSKEHTTGKTPPLSPLGECCMARKLREDYQIIQTMLGDSGNNNNVVEPLEYAHPTLVGACSWGKSDQQELCRSDLKSMLARRAQYLDLSLGTCSNIVSNTDV